MASINGKYTSALFDDIKHRYEKTYIASFTDTPSLIKDKNENIMMYAALVLGSNKVKLPKEIIEKKSKVKIANKDEYAYKKIEINDDEIEEIKIQSNEIIKHLFDIKRLLEKNDEYKDLENKIEELLSYLNENSLNRENIIFHTEIIDLLKILKNILSSPDPITAYANNSNKIYRILYGFFFDFNINKLSEEEIQILKTILNIFIKLSDKALYHEDMYFYKKIIKNYLRGSEK